MWPDEDLATHDVYASGLANKGVFANAVDDNSRGLLLNLK